MWVFTPEGFVSAVEDRNDPTTIMVRARDKQSLVQVCEVSGLTAQLDIVSYAGTDYPFRVAISRTNWEDFVIDASRRITYPNFKDAAKATRGQAYADVLGRVWAAGLALTPTRVARRQRAIWDQRRAERGALAYLGRR